MRTPGAPRAVASLLVIALLHGSFGPSAWAQVATLGNVPAPVGGSGVAGVAGSVQAGPGSVSLPTLGLSGPALTPNAAPVLTPSAIPSASFTAGAQAAALPRTGAAPVAGSAQAAPSRVASRAPVAGRSNRVLEAVASAVSHSLAPSRAAARGASSALSEGRAAEAAAEAPAVSGALTSGIGAKVKARFAELRKLFAGKSAQILPNEASVTRDAEVISDRPEAELQPAQADAAKTSGGDRAPPPPSKPGDGGKDGKDGKKGWFGLGAVVAGLIGGLLVMQFGLEAQGAAMAQLTEEAFGDFSILAQVTIFAQIGSMVGQQLSQFFTSKFGMTKTFYGAHVLRAVSLGAMVMLLGSGMMPLPLMFLFYAFNGVVTGIAGTAEGTLRKFLLQQQGVSQQKFRTWWQLLAEIIAVPAPMVLGALVPVLGAGWITGIYPATILIGLMLFMMLKIFPWSAARRIETLAAAASATAPKAVSAEPVGPKGSAWSRIKDALKQIFNNMEEGKRYVFSNPVLKYSLAGAVIFDLMNLMIYRLIAPGYGKLVAGSAGMAAVQGNLVGMFSLGGLLLAATFLLLEARAKRKAKPATKAEAEAKERSSLLKWMFAGIPALALLATMGFSLSLPFPPIMFMDVNWVPGTVLAAALVPFGFFQVASSIKLNSYFTEKLPDDPAVVQKALAFSGSAMTALSIVLMLALKPLFGDIGGFNPFPYLAAALVPVGALLFFLHRWLAGATKPDAPSEPGAPAGKPGGFVGVLLGVMAAALLLTAVPFIPGVAGLVAGLGVLGKFALHLAIALALPAAGFFGDRWVRNRKAK